MDESSCLVWQLTTGYSQLLHPGSAFEDLLHLVGEHAIESVADAGIRVLAEEQVAAPVGVGVHGVDDLHARVGVEVVAVGDHTENLLRRAIEINLGDHGNEVVELASRRGFAGATASLALSTRVGELL